MKQTKPFQIKIIPKDKQALRESARLAGFDYGIFIDTSGKAHIERVRETAQYNYLFRTNFYNLKK